MDSLTFLLVTMSLATAWTCFHLLRRSSKLPPGPRPLPIIGNLLQLGQNPHVTLATLSKTYGPLMYLKLGNKHTIVVSSPEMAKEILRKHDLVFSSRPIPDSARAFDHHKGSIAWLPAGDKWRQMRKVCKEQLFSIERLDESQGIRREKLHQLHDYVEKCCISGRAVNIGQVAFITSLNLIFSMMFSVDFAAFDSDSGKEIMGTVQGLMTILGTPNLINFFPVLGIFDPQRIKKKSELYFGKLIAIIDDIVSQRLNSRPQSRKKDFLEILLDLNEQNGSDFSIHDIESLLVDILVGGADTSGNSVEWIMTELLHNPDKMLKLKNEFKTVIGENKRVKESDISRLPYLNSVIKETLRLHPPGPFLMPHKANEEVQINGYMIPKNSQLLVNVWAIGRDSTIWSNPNSFEPERFLNSKVDYKGQDFELIPFSSGRRICPGLLLAHQMLHLVVATLIYNFSWKLERSAKIEEIDTKETFGLLLHKIAALKAIPFACQSQD